MLNVSDVNVLLRVVIIVAAVLFWRKFWIHLIIDIGALMLVNVLMISACETES